MQRGVDDRWGWVLQEEKVSSESLDLSPNRLFEVGPKVAPFGESHQSADGCIPFTVLLMDSSHRSAALNRSLVPDVKDG